MSDRVTARACSNIALCKYWGKLGVGNAPATPSISLALAALHVSVTVSPGAQRRDEITLPPGVNTPAAIQRVVKYLDYWRSCGLIRGYFSIESHANFPADSGLASSAAAFAALAQALSAFASGKLSESRLSRLARHGSGSAARSITGGLSALPAGMDPAARLLAPAAAVPWGMVIAQLASAKKAVSSRAGMAASRRTSPYYDSWLKQAARDYRRMRQALAGWDLDAVGRIAEANMLAMHAVMQTTRPALLYWLPATLELVGLAATLRRQGRPVYATIDAGPNVALLCRQEDLKRVARRARRVGGVSTVVESLPGGPAEFVD